MKKALIIILLLMLPACGHVDMSISDQIVVKKDSPVRKSSLQVAVHPRGKQFRPLTAYFHPFVIQQQSTDYRHLSTAFAEIFHAAWMEDRLFPVMELDRGKPYRGLESALKKARSRGADLMVIGYVPYFYAGHTLDDNAITIQVDIYAAASGTLLWSMKQSGRIEEKQPQDWIYFRQEYRMTTGPFSAIIRGMAKDMAIPLKAWLPAPDTEFNFAKTPDAMESNLTGETPAPERIQQPDMKKEDSEGYTGDIDPDEEAKRPQVNGVNLDVHFDFDKNTIKQESYALLDALGEALSSPELKGKQIIIAGHTDTKGTDVYNLALSKKRANSIKAYLVNKWGIEPSTLEAVGYGKSRPLTSGMSAEDQQKNRRVEIRLAE